jgi:hypothetical protein
MARPKRSAHWTYSHPRAKHVGVANCSCGARYSAASAYIIIVLLGCTVAWVCPMTQNADVQGLQSKAEARLALLKEEKLVTRISVLSTLFGQGRKTERLMIGISIETHKTSPDFDQKKCNEAYSRIMQALGDIGCDVFIEMDR